MKLSESIEKQLKEFDEEFVEKLYPFLGAMSLHLKDLNSQDREEQEVKLINHFKLFLRTAIKQAILDIVPEDGDWSQFGCASWGVYKSELLKRINE